MNSRQWLSLILATVLIAQVAVAPVAAQSSESPISSLGDTVCNPIDENVTTLDCIRAGNSGIMSVGERLQFKAASVAPIGDSDPKVQQYADDVQTTYNNNSDTLENYTNARFDGDATKYDVIKLEFKQGGETATRYLTADASNSNFSNSSVTNTTDRTVDHTVTFHDFAAADASDELQRFVDKYASKDKDIDPQLVNRLANRYAGDVDLPKVLQP